MQLIVMNPLNAEVGIGIRVDFHDNKYKRELGNMPGYSLQLTSLEDFDGWLLLSGENEASGPWMFIDKDKLKKDFVVVGEL